jgi:CheY-like chemotaxis protein
MDAARADGHTVLYVEDDIDLRDSIAMALEAEGFRVVGAANGQTGLDYLRSDEHTCLVLLDLMVPVMDGWQFMAEKTRDPALAPIPVVIVSGHASVPQQARVLKASGYLVKPIDIERLISITHRYCLGGPPVSRH